MALVVDIHTHMYPPSFIKLLKSRNTLPYIREVPDSDIARLVILPSDDDQTKPPETRGRPLGPDYWQLERKVKFMDAHKIDISVISLANPWLDFLPTDVAATTAQEINDDLDASCAKHPGRLFAFGTLPLSGGTDAVAHEVERLKGSKHMRGVILGTTGLGMGLDDPSLDPIWQKLESTDTLIFLHPHYGMPMEVFGPRASESGHVLPLALGFPFETTIAVTRMFLSGVFDRFPDLQVLLAHSGGTLPFLAGRIESCIAHDGHLKGKGFKRDLWEVLEKNIFLDAVVYSSEGVKAAIDASGPHKLMFGMLKPFVMYVAVILTRARD